MTNVFRVVFSGLAAASLASAALAQPEVQYQVVGSVSSEWTVKPWPNGNQPGLSRATALDFVSPGRVVLSDINFGWIIRDGSAALQRSTGQPIPGLAGARWASVLNIYPRFYQDVNDGFIMSYAPSTQGPSVHLRANASGFENCQSPLVSNSRGESAGLTALEGSIGIGLAGGPYLEIYTRRPGVVAGLPGWLVNTFFPIAAGEDGRMWFFGRGFSPQSGLKSFVASARASQGVAVFEIVQNQPANPVGEFTSFETGGSDIVAGADDGTIVLNGYVRPTGSPTNIHGMWAIGPGGLWSLIHAFDAPADQLPQGVVFRADQRGAVALNRDGVYADCVTLAGEGVTEANDSAVIRWSASTGLQILAREGDPVPGDAAGRLFGHLLSVHLSNRGDLAFVDSGAVYLHHPAVGLASVARAGEAVAGGLATNLAAVSVGTSYFVGAASCDGPAADGPNGIRTWIDDEGRLYFAAWTPPHMVAYSAQLTLTCPADFNRDGFTDFFDYSDYVTCFEISDCPAGRGADFNADGFVDFFDYVEFVEAFETGCG